MNINPFRYRSYYYDVETGLYYLQTRYYDPEVGRFINSDALEYLGDGAELSNYNLFAYCGNNPIILKDENGTYSYCNLNNDYVEHLRIRNESLGNSCSLGTPPPEIVPQEVIDKVEEDLQNFSFFNSNELTVLRSNYFSMYKGQLVIRFYSDDIMSFQIFGIIFLNHNEDSNVRRGMLTVKHEHGHGIQERLMGGTLPYLFNVAIPSVIINCMGEDLPYEYYSYPWEAQAEVLGKVYGRIPDGDPNLPRNHWIWWLWYLL